MKDQFKEFMILWYTMLTIGEDYSQCNNFDNMLNYHVPIVILGNLSKIKMLKNHCIYFVSDVINVQNCKSIELGCSRILFSDKPNFIK